jgi:glucose-1-phosphate adenylyltransferase
LPIYSKSLNLNPHVILSKGQAKQSVIADGCLINGTVIHSTVAYACNIEEGTKIIDCVLLPNVTVGKFCYLKNVIVNKGVIIPENYRVEPEKLTLLTEDNLYEVGGIYE